MSKRRALDQCRREVDNSRARPTVVDEPLDDLVFIVWPSIGRQLPPRSGIFDMLCFYATAMVRSDLMQPLAFDESAWLADQLVDRVIDLGDSEEETFWTEFLRSLRRRGLTGVRLVISDAHEGLKNAARKTLQGSSWQRCRVHFARINRPSGVGSSDRASLDGFEVVFEVSGGASVAACFAGPAALLGVVA